MAEIERRNWRCSVKDALIYMPLYPSQGVDFPL